MGGRRCSYVWVGLVVCALCAYANRQADTTISPGAFTSVRASWGFNTRSVEISARAGTIQAKTLDGTRVQMHVSAAEVATVEYAARIAVKDLDPSFVGSYIKTLRYPEDGIWEIMIRDESGKEYYMRQMKEGYLRKAHLMDIATYIRMCDLSDMVVRLCMQQMPKDQHLAYSNPLNLHKPGPRRKGSDPAQYHEDEL